MTLLDAQEFDLERARKRRNRIISAIVIVLLVAGLLWWFRYWPEEHVARQFFSALQKQDYKSAYGIWMHDPQWAQHPEQHAKYPFNEFYQDWGPGGQWGLIKTQKEYGVSACPGGGSGVVVDFVVNDRTEHAQVWVEKSDKTLSYPPGPCELVFR
ncbi:MAG TPA: hypothetical protein VGM18_16245 [Candidatus Sulfotelmatobacter sp.]|jgi:hypothetical protein